MSAKRRVVLASLVFFAFTAPLGIAAHLVSELAGLGYHDDASLAFSGRHAYFAALALLAIGGLRLALAAVPRRERRAQVADLVENLPFGGRGPAFAALSFLAQFAFFAITQIGEGCPLCGGDVVVGVFAAGIAALLGALALALAKRRILELVLGLAFAGSLLSRASAGVIRSAIRRCVTLRSSRRRTPFAFRYRPPPLVRL